MALTITSASSIADVKAAYLDNADYDLVGDVEKAQQFIVACRYLLIRLPKRSALGNKHTEEEWDPTVIERQMGEARRWLLANKPSYLNQSTTHFFTR